jgi:hypothetical protein
VVLVFAREIGVRVGQGCQRIMAERLCNLNCERIEVDEVWGFISGDGFHELYAPAEERLNQLQTEPPKLEAEVDFMRVNKLSADDIFHEANSLYDKWLEMPLETKRKIAESLVEKIVIGDGEIDINFSSIPSSGELCKNQQGLRSG